MPGSDEVVGIVEAFLPMRQRENSMLFASLRGLSSSYSVYEGNLGFGYRRLVGDGNWILGGFGYLDRRRSRNALNFHQLTLGFEALSKFFDARMNVYLPEQGRKRYRTEVNNRAVLQGNIAFRPGTEITRYYERAMRGADFEFGTRVPWMAHSRIYVGGFHFRTGDAPSMTGGRLRTETQVASMLSVGGRYEHDNIRGHRGFLELNFRWRPFGHKEPDRVRRPMSYRMTDRVVRDIDIQVASRIRDHTPPLQVRDQSGSPQQIWYVKNDAPAGGDGTFEDPFDTLAEAQAASGANDIIYVYRGDGTTTGQAAGITLQAGQQLFGEGVGLVLGGTRYLSAGSKARITGVTAITLADDNEVAGLHIDNPTTGISGTSITDFNLHDNCINDATTAVSLTGAVGTGIFSDNEVTDVTGRSMLLTNTAGTLTLTMDGNTFDATGAGGNAGAVTFNPATNAIVNATITNNTFTNQVTNSLAITLANDATGTYTITGNSFTNSGTSDTIALQATDDTTITATVSSNTIDGGDHGVGLAGSDNGVVRATVNSNSIDNVTQNGINIRGVNDLTLGVTANSNTIDAGADSINILMLNTSDLEIITDGNTFTSVGDGIDMGDASTGTVCMAISNNTANGPDPDYRLTSVAGTFNYENLIEGTNTGAFAKVGETNVATGTCAPMSP